MADKTPASFRLSVPIDIRFSDTDAMGHVNNAAYLSYLEFARMKYWQKLTGEKNFRKTNFILAHVSIDYLSPSYVGESLLVFIRIREISRASFRFEYEIQEAQTRRPVAKAETVQVMYDYAAGKVVRMEEAFRKRIQEFEGGPA